MRCSRKGPPVVRELGAAGSLGLAAAGARHGAWLVSPRPLATWAAWGRAFGGAGFHVPPLVMAAMAPMAALVAAGSVAPSLPVP